MRIVKSIYTVLGLLGITCIIAFVLFVCLPPQLSRYIFWFQAYVYPARKVTSSKGDVVYIQRLLPPNGYTGKWDIWEQDLELVATGYFLDGLPVGTWKIYEFYPIYDPDIPLPSSIYENPTSEVNELSIEIVNGIPVSRDKLYGKYWTSEEWIIHVLYSYYPHFMDCCVIGERE